MAQESWKESDETECQKPEGPVLCANNCGFFGSAATNDLCSKCYRDMFMNQQLVVTSVSLMAEKKSTTALTSMQAELAVELDKVEKVQVFHVDASQSEEISNKQPANRCLMCRKRVGLVGFKCRCGGTFCSTHRYSEMHTCSFDYRSAGREAIAKANPVVRAEKIEKI